jgi:catechol 2,3-dioxygenase-like lactoylglutathione lyase family enzyme
MVDLSVLAQAPAAQEADGPPMLPLRSPGLEHLGLTVPDPEAAAKFYGRIFGPQLFREREAPPRYYVMAGTAYLAFGGSATVTPLVDHLCARPRLSRTRDASGARGARHSIRRHRHD